MTTTSNAAVMAAIAGSSAAAAAKRARDKREAGQMIACSANYNPDLCDQLCIVEEELSRQPVSFWKDKTTLRGKNICIPNTYYDSYVTERISGLGSASLVTIAVLSVLVVLALIGNLEN